MKMIYQLQKLTVIDRRNQTSVKIYRLIFKNALHHSYKLELPTLIKLSITIF